MRVRPAPYCPSCGAQVLPPATDPFHEAFLRGVRAGLERAAVQAEEGGCLGMANEGRGCDRERPGQHYYWCSVPIAAAIRAIDPESVKEERA